MDKKDIIVIGASSGGLEVLKQLLSNLGSNINAAIFITRHMSADVLGVLPGILRKHSTLPIDHAQDFAPIELNRVYVAPPDRRLLVEKDHVRRSKGPKENCFRPAIDPLFRSARTLTDPGLLASSYQVRLTMATGPSKQRHTYERKHRGQ